MCLVLIAYKARPDSPLIIAANRDEFHGRPTRPAAFWDDHPDILGGRDLLHGGTWLAVDRRGRLAAVTNYREPAEPQPNLRSRGFLITDYLTGGAAPLAYLTDLAGRVREYDGFNIFVGDATALYSYCSYLQQPGILPAGIHGISNGDLDYPWPKVTRGKQALQALAAVGSRVEPESLFQILRDRTVPDGAGLPATGVGVQLERMLAPIFVTGKDYGTRSSTVLIMKRDGHVYFAERSFGPAGELTKTVEYKFRIE